MRPIWEELLTRKPNVSNNYYGILEGMWNERQRKYIQLKLFEIKKFIEENSKNIVELHLDRESFVGPRALNASELTNIGEIASRRKQEELEAMILNEKVYYFINKTIIEIH